MSGVERIAAAFESARAEGRAAALMPYLMGGFPDLPISAEIGHAYASAGADVIELGVPFSDPLADGPVIHAAGSAALRAGTRMADVLTLAGELAREVPVVLMCYSNQALARGVERFVAELAASGACGLIVPDLPLEGSSELRDHCDEAGLALVPLVAPTTPAERLRRIGADARGFLYTVAQTGTTGERAALAGGLEEMIARAASSTEVPVAVGFGIGSPEQAAAAAAAGADGVIVGTRLVRAVSDSEDPASSLGKLVGEFAAALAGDDH